MLPAPAAYMSCDRVLMDGLLLLLALLAIISLHTLHQAASVVHSFTDTVLCCKPHDTGNELVNPRFVQEWCCVCCVIPVTCRPS